MKRNGLTTKVLLSVLLPAVLGVPVHGRSHLPKAKLLVEGMT